MDKTALVFSLYDTESKKRIVTHSVSAKQMRPILEHVARAVEQHGGSGKVDIRVRGVQLAEGAFIQDDERLESITTLVTLAMEHYTHKRQELSEKLHKVISNPDKLKKLIDGLKKMQESDKEEDTLKLPDLEVGDTLLVGKFKNRKAEIKGFDTDENGQPVADTTKGDQKIFKPRIEKLMPGHKDEEQPVKEDERPWVPTSKFLTPTESK